MKKFTFIIAFVCITIIGYSQNNLQFNQVLTYVGVLNIPFVNNENGYDSSAIFTVPPGKVWKIESMSSAQGLSGFVSNGALYFQLNDVTIKKYIPINNPNPDNITPLWLKANDKIRFMGVSNSSAGSLSYHISIIEYNIIL